MLKTKVQKIPKVQMEHFQDLIIDLNITRKRKERKEKKFHWTLYNNNIFELLNVNPNLIYFEKTSKFINNVFLNIKKTRSQMNQMKYIYTKKLDGSSINDKVQSSYNECTPKETK